jgi:hypothetical protein
VSRKREEERNGGLHLLDANVELGNLVSVVAGQVNSWLDLRYSH